MKKILSSLLGGLLFLSGTLAVSAHHYTPYYNTYQNTPRSNSYVYTQGCYIYQYDAYTRITSLIGSTCTTAYPTYGSSYDHTRSYSYPVMTSYPVTTSYVSPSSYYTYGYYDGSWYAGYQNSLLGNLFTNTGYGNSYMTGYGNSYMNNCYYQNGYQVCY